MCSHTAKYLGLGDCHAQQPVWDLKNLIHKVDWNCSRNLRHMAATATPAIERLDCFETSRVRPVGQRFLPKPQKLFDTPFIFRASPYAEHLRAGCKDIRYHPSSRGQVESGLERAPSGEALTLTCSCISSVIAYPPDERLLRLWIVGDTPFWTRQVTSVGFPTSHPLVSLEASNEMLKRR